MRDSQSPRLHRPSSMLVVTASLALVAGLGLARTVWGGPPAQAAPPEDGAAEAQPEAGADTPDAQPAGEAEASPSADPPPLLDAPAPTPAEASQLRGQMESGMAEIGELAVEARADDDLVRATCVLDKQDRASDVMELGTSEMLVIRDPNASEQARSFAIEKLDAAAGRIDKLVDDAKACAGRQGPEAEVDMTRNESDEPRTIPIWNPSAGVGDTPVPPPVDGGWPLAASPVE